MPEDDEDRSAASMTCQVGGDRHVGDPVSLSTGESVLQESDLQIDNWFQFRRDFSSRPVNWLQTGLLGYGLSDGGIWRPAPYLPVPFGQPDSPDNEGLHWVHNYYSFVHVRPDSWNVDAAALKVIHPPV